MNLISPDLGEKITIGNTLSRRRMANLERFSSSLILIVVLVPAPPLSHLPTKTE